MLVHNWMWMCIFFWFRIILRRLWTDLVIQQITTDAMYSNVDSHNFERILPTFIVCSLNLQIQIISCRFILCIYKIINEQCVAILAHASFSWGFEANHHLREREMDLFDIYSNIGPLHRPRTEENRLAGDNWKLVDEI